MDPQGDEKDDEEEDEQRVIADASDPRGGALGHDRCLAVLERPEPGHPVMV